MTIHDKDLYKEVTDEEIKNRIDKLVAEYEEITPSFTKMIKKWGRIRREISSLNEEISRRENGKK